MKIVEELKAILEVSRRRPFGILSKEHGTRLAKFPGDGLGSKEIEWASPGRISGEYATGPGATAPWRTRAEAQKAAEKLFGPDWADKVKIADVEVS